MDSMEPEQTPFGAVSEQTSRIQRVCDRWMKDYCVGADTFVSDISNISRQVDPVYGV